MIFKRLSACLSWDGRYSRKQYWFGWFILIMIPVCLLLLSWLEHSITGISDDDYGFFFLLFMFWIVIGKLIFGLPVVTKRLHDVNKSAWWLIPYIAFTFISLIVLGCIKGTSGKNRYGPDPLEKDSSETL